MASDETTTAGNEEEYLYLYDYAIDEKTYNWFGYFKNYQEAEATILLYNAAAPYIKTISLKECPYGVKWRGLLIPYKKSDWEKMHELQR